MIIRKNMEDLIKDLESLKLDGIILDEYDRSYNFAINDAIKVVEKYKINQKEKNLKKEEEKLQRKIEKLKLEKIWKI